MAKEIKIYAGGKMANTPWGDICTMYLQRLRMWSVGLVECEDTWFQNRAREMQGQCFKPMGKSLGKNLGKSPEKGLLKNLGKKKEILLSFHEKGLEITGESYKKFLNQWMQGADALCIFIGPSHGLPPALVEGSHHCFSLGKLTWCHLSARAMVLQQLYRAQQGILNHPYSLI